MGPERAKNYFTLTHKLFTSLPAGIGSKALDRSGSDSHSLSGMHHVRVPVSNPEAAAAWFADLLGYEKAFPFRSDGAVVGWAMQHNGGGPSLAVVEDPVRARALAGFPLFAFAVPDEETAHRLASGLDARGIPHGGVQPALVKVKLPFVAGPDGILLGFYVTDQAPGSRPEPQGIASFHLKERTPMDTTMTTVDAAGHTRLRNASLFLARLGLASLFIFSGLQKLTSLHGAAEWAASQGVPFAQQLMPMAAVFEIVAGLMLVTGWRARTAAGALAGWIIVLGPLFHQFWNAPPQLWQSSIDNFFHHLVMFGGMIYVAAFGPGGWTLATRKR